MKRIIMRIKVSSPLGAGFVSSALLICSSSIQQAPGASWVPTASMHTAREFHTATVLPSGKVLVAGGGGGSGFTPLSSAEVYDPVNGTWATTGSLINARYYHTATLLNNGKVLVAGGAGTTPAFTSAELYDPATGEWSLTRPMNALHAQHAATLLPNGQVLVAGGAASNRAELYDPTTGSWTLTGPETDRRNSHTATLLNGKVLVAGGFDLSAGPALTSAELYDPNSGIWTATGSLLAARANHVAVLLPNGQVLVAGGRTAAGFLASAELYSSATATWTNTGPLNNQRYAHSATLLGNGLVLVAGGCGTNGRLSSVELFNPSTGSWTTTASLATPREYHAATLLPNGTVLVTGGDTTGSVTTATAELYDLNNPPIAHCRNVLKEADTNCLARVTPGEVDDGSADPDGDPVTLSLSPPGPYPLGVTPVTLIVADNHGETNTCNAAITVLDTQPPLVASSVRRSVLWPPNHKLVNVGLDTVAVDECASAGPVTVRVFSNEDDGASSGHGAPDASDIAPGTLKLRSERKGHPFGRIYLIVVIASDSSGNLGVNCCTVVIPTAQSAATLVAVEAAASQASAYCLLHSGAPPPGYFRIGAVY